MTQNTADHPVLLLHAMIDGITPVEHGLALKCVHRLREGVPDKLLAANLRDAVMVAIENIAKAGVPGCPVERFRMDARAALARLEQESHGDGRPL